MLDGVLGKIELVPHRQGLTPGMLISYHARVHNNIYFAHTIDIIDVPIALVQNDILFFHHVLELCDYFVPLHSCVQGVFDLLLVLYVADNLVSCTISKKIFLIKIFMLLGMHPEEDRFQTPYFCRLPAESIDTITQQTIESKCEKELDEWLLNCVSSHLHSKELKTMQFLNKNRAA